MSVNPPPKYLPSKNLSPAPPKPLYKSEKNIEQPIKREEDSWFNWLLSFILLSGK